MKKLTALLLALVLTVGLCACSSNPYEKYEYINKMLDEGDYEGAVKAIYQLYQMEQSVNGSNNNDGNNSGNNGNSSGNNGGEVKAEPTEDEIKLLNQYRSIYEFLNDKSSSVRDYETEEYYSGQQALQFCYEMLPELSGIDKWAESDFVKNDYRYSEIENWDRDYLLRGFTVIKDVPLNMGSTTKDNLGNVSENKNIAVWYYNADGTLERLTGEQYMQEIRHFTQYNSCQFAYDTQGHLAEKTYGSGDSVYARVTYTYDTAGNITKEMIKTNSSETEYTYTYESGRLAQISWQTSETQRYTIDYTYDASGKLIKEEKINYYLGPLVKVWTMDAKDIVEYTYTNGKLTSGTYTYQNWDYYQDYSHDSTTGTNKWFVQKEYASTEAVDRYTYTCDSQGRVVKKTVLPGNEVVAYGEEKGKVLDTPDYETKSYDTVYGDYYIYTPAN